jgi:hypothetical protein
MSAPLWALRVAFGRCTHTTLVSLAAILRFTVPSPSLPWWGLGQEIDRGDGASLIMEGIATGLG